MCSSDVHSPPKISYTVLFCIYSFCFLFPIMNDWNDCLNHSNKLKREIFINTARARAHTRQEYHKIKSRKIQEEMYLKHIAYLYENHNLSKTSRRFYRSSPRDLLCVCVFCIFFVLLVISCSPFIFSCFFLWYILFCFVLIGRAKGRVMVRNKKSISYFHFHSNIVLLFFSNTITIENERKKLS